ncbi:DUF4055 domain-containing protein [Cupriavidus taiwanensis]|uniref:DUF4055 domain-containing protein n=1 Tax=Cupriavidus taiwanensis TaxID=164546 RepID=UPI000E10A59F|nr:DUF4055 domain-containing protein [Cupriavidus taiwanensis]SOY56844.1 conserved exported hypothetical protein [Cupriavidus taiwanensis]SOY90773.1 conserved exported hypothetical protein [Cupriavidus taiwanensis]SOZ63552.1 conserved exported hypothetical protein [Cupriavidus taiwanensis]SOZ82588.1 conserved exported hypothetical protein [Cupriavidus taiwanensis]SOZ84437.1 conserved exported hypothetical protein [Cupriavidus taiwanensis]
MNQQPNVRTRSKAAEKMAANWAILTALLSGTAAMRAAGKTFLPKWPNEVDAAYTNRLATATLFPAFGRTVEVLAGKPFSKPITIGDDVPARLKAWCENIDLQGRNLHAFAAAIFTDALSDGVVGILVDHPPTKDKDGNALYPTQALEQKAGVRPYFVQIKYENVLGWKSERIEGVETLTQLRLLECAVEDEGDFHEREIEQVRVLYPGRWETWREVETGEGRKEWQKHDEGVVSLQKIPFVPTYGKRTGFMIGTPPLLELAHLNVEHWQSKSDQQTILHVARVPILFAKNLDTDEAGNMKLVVGASSAVTSSNEHGDLRYVEHTGKAIEAGRLSLQDLEHMMRQIGAELLVIKPGNTTVKQTEADNEPGMCVLQRITEDVEDAIDAALQLMAEWVGEKTGGHIQLFKDFGVASLSEASLELLLEMNVAGTLSDETLFDETQRRGVISPERKWKEEKERIKKNAPKKPPTKPSNPAAD